MGTTSSSLCGSVAADVHPQLEQEWAAVLDVYPGSAWNESPERVQVPLVLEEGQYSRGEVPVGVLIPVGYRATGPDGFVVPDGLRFADGTSLPASDAAGIGLPGWLLVSFHHVDDAGQSTWRATADPDRGDNLVGYLGSIESFLARRCA